jgi:virulence-associated protein VapD
MVELVMPHMVFDIDTMKLQTTKMVCRNIVASRKDWSGVRTTFAVKESKESVYVDIDNCNDVYRVRKVEELLKEKEQGIAKSRIKAKNRRLVLEGQITMDEYVSSKSEVG